MSTVETVKNELITIIDKANAKTGISDSTLSEAVDRLINGYNPNGSSGGGAENFVTRTVTNSSTLGGTSATINTLITGDSFIKSHYSDDGFFVTLMPVSPVAASTGAVIAVTHTNRQLPSHATRYTGWGIYWSSATVVAGYPISTNVSGSTYQAAFRVNSSGNLVLYLPASRYLAAGTYQIVMGVAG